MTKEKFSLKDELFNQKKVEYIARLILEVYPKFEHQKFTKQVLEKFPILELKQRIFWIRENLKFFLPNQYTKAVAILLASLPSACDSSKTDNDFGDFIFAPFGDFVATYGYEEKYLELSLGALKEITMRFSMEDSIRFFLKKFQKKTLIFMEQCAQDNNYHVRRLASEGTRPSLPWSQKLELDNQQIIETILDRLYTDNTRYVVRSVANHINDISKQEPELVIQTLNRWKQSGKQIPKEIEYLVSHSLRTLVKKGNPQALEMLGYSSNPNISVKNFSVHTQNISLGESITFCAKIFSEQENNLMIDYIVEFPGKNGVLRPKVFKVKKITIPKGESIQIQKSHGFKPMTTRKLYAGMHTIALQINGKIFEKKNFFLEV